MTNCGLGAILDRIGIFYLYRYWHVPLLYRPKERNKNNRYSCKCSPCASQQHPQATCDCESLAYSLIVSSQHHAKLAHKQNENTALHARLHGRPDHSIFIRRKPNYLLFSVDVRREDTLNGQLHTLYNNCLLHRDSQCLPRKYLTLLIETN